MVPFDPRSIEMIQMSQSILSWMSDRVSRKTIAGSLASCFALCASGSLVLLQAPPATARQKPFAFQLRIQSEPGCNDLRSCGAYVRSARWNGRYMNANNPDRITNIRNLYIGTRPIDLREYNRLMDRYWPYRGSGRASTQWMCGHKTKRGIVAFTDGGGSTFSRRSPLVVNDPFDCLCPIKK